MDKRPFQYPSMDCRAAPFWSWNGELKPEETRWQVREMVAQGMGGAFMHARGGLRTEYLGKDWFANVRASVDEGKKLGFASWVYDEDCWPSGSCAGQTAAADPSFCARALYHRVGAGDLYPKAPSVPLADMEFLGCFAMTGNDDAGWAFDEAPADKAGTDGFVSFYASTFGPVDGRVHYPDLMHDGAVAEFIRNTYERYAACCSGDFGDAVPGVFTDEPLMSGELPWSVRFVGEFEKRRGYDLRAKLPHLVFPTEQSPKTRHDYWQTASELFSESYAGQLGHWCAEHGIAFTGHLFAEGGLGSQIRSAGGCMPNYVHMQVPGIDMLCESISEGVTVKQCTSVANQFGRKRALSELYGAAGYNFSFEGQKWIGDWQMAMGINLLCPHLSHYTMKGGGKRDYPPSYMYQSPWWRHYRFIADYQARLAYALQQGRVVRDILVVHPLTSGWMMMGSIASTHHVAKVDEHNKALMATLLGLHRDFDYGDESIMAGHAEVRGSELIVGEASYRSVVLPRMTNIESTTLDLLETFLAGGGHVVFTDVPAAMVDGQTSDRARSLTSSPGVVCLSHWQKELEEALEGVLPRHLSLLDSDTGDQATDVLHMERRDGDETILFVANTSRERSASLGVRLRGDGAWETWDCETGHVQPVASALRDGWSVLNVELPPVGSALLVRRPGVPVALPDAGETRTETSLVFDGPWAFRRMAPNSLILDRCRWRVAGGTFSEPMFLLAAQREWRQQLKPPLCQGQPWRNLANPDSIRPVGNVELQFEVLIDVVPAAETFLVLEDRDEATIAVNGEGIDAPAVGWFMDKGFEMVPIGKALTKGRNLIEVRVPVCGANTVEDMYLVGDFGVDAESFSLVAEPKTLAKGDWSMQGYRFYTDRMLYETPFHAPADHGRMFVEFDDFKGTVAAVWLNGEKVATLGWKPYRVEITKVVREGENVLGVEIVGSAHNLMGPRHSAETNPRWTGPGELSSVEKQTYNVMPAGLMSEVRVTRDASVAATEKEQAS